MPRAARSKKAAYPAPAGDSSATWAACSGSSGATSPSSHASGRSPRPRSVPTLTALRHDCLRRLRELGERGRVAHREVGEQLPVHVDVGLLEAGDQRAVGEPVDARRGVDARDPQTPEVALARAPVLVGELAGTL